MERGRRLITRHAGIFLFLPLLAQIRFDQIVTATDYPGTQMNPASNALLSWLTLKLLDKERLSHIDDFNCDEALGLFAGLNLLPKKSFATDYSYRTIRDNQVLLLERWVKQLSPLLFPDADYFSLDFHAIGHRGEKTSGAVEIASGHRIFVYLDRRSHNPILREAQLDKDHIKIPWLANHKHKVVFS